MATAQSSLSSMFDKWPQAASFSLEPFLEFNKISTNIYSKIARENLQAVNELMQCNTELMQGLSHIKRFDEVMNVQAHWIQKVMPIFFEHTKHRTEIMMESVSEYQQLLTKCIHQFEKEGKTIQEK